jgi:hypothetical protein
MEASTSRSEDSSFFPQNQPCLFGNSIHFEQLVTHLLAMYQTEEHHWRVIFHWVAPLVVSHSDLEK